MKTDNDKLQALRREIDAIDDSIHDLIMERTKIVERVRDANGVASAPDAARDRIRVLKALTARLLG